MVLPQYRSRVSEHLKPDASVSLRFEGILDVWSRFDPALRVLDTYRLGTPTSEHRALARLAESHAIVTTNFDGLIERSWACPRDLPVACTDEQFLPEPGDGGLYKIHGTVQRVVNGCPQDVASLDGSFCIATLGTISSNMESIPRRNFLHCLRRSRPLVVVGYSGMDDFDVCRWLFDTDSPKALVWIAYDENAESTTVLSGREAIDLKVAPRPIMRRKADRNVVNTSTIVRTRSPAKLLADLSGEPYDDKSWGSKKLEWGATCLWQRSLATALLLLQLSLFHEAENLLRGLLQNVEGPLRGHDDDLALSPAQQTCAQVYLAQALMPTGERRKRREALEIAEAAADSGLLEPALLLRARFLATQARFHTSHMSASALGDSLANLYVQAKACDAPALAAELAADIAVFGRQQARTHRAMYSAFEAALDGGSLSAKGTRLHEDARRKWSACGSPEELSLAISDMEEVVTFRRDLGQLDGLCASLNVCGGMRQRLAEWTSPMEPDYGAAIQYHNESLRLAANAHLFWHQSQALIDLGYIHAKSADAARLKATIEELNVLCEILDESDRHHMEFLAAYARVIAKDLTAAKRRFEKLIDLPESAKLGARMRDAARFNAAVCRAALTAGLPGPPELPPSHRCVRFWEDRFVRHTLYVPIVSTLIDPLPPSN
nr:SIR2 family protein [Aquabacterium terrae]